MQWAQSSILSSFSYLMFQVKFERTLYLKLSSKRKMVEKRKKVCYSCVGVGWSLFYWLWPSIIIYFFYARIHTALPLSHCSSFFLIFSTHTPKNSFYYMSQNFQKKYKKQNKIVRKEERARERTELSLSCGKSEKRNSKLTKKTRKNEAPSWNPKPCADTHTHSDHREKIYSSGVGDTKT